MHKKYPFDELQVDDAFDVPIGSVTYASLAAYASKKGKELGVRFSIRTVKEEGVWEVSRRPLPAVKPARTVPARTVPVKPARIGSAAPVSREEREAQIAAIRRQLDAG